MHYYAYSLYYSLYISHGAEQENFINNQERHRSVFSSFIHKTIMFDSAVILKERSKCESPECLAQWKSLTIYIFKKQKNVCLFCRCFLSSFPILSLDFCHKLVKQNLSET